MRTIKLVLAAVALAGLTGIPLAAQQPSSNPSPGSQPQSTPAQPVAGSPQGAGSAETAPGTANSPEASNAQLRPVTGELVSKLDSKSAKPGDPVVVKTTEKATIADGVVIPKGSKIVGHVTDVQAHSKDNENAKVTLQFDQAELKDGQTLPIKSVLQSVSAPDTGHLADSFPMPTGSAGSAAPGVSSPGMSGSPGGSGSAGGQAQSRTGAAPSMPSGMSSQSGSSSSAGGPAAGTVVATQGNIAIKTTGIPGVLLAGNANGQPFSNASGALLGARQNVHLDGGTQVVLAVADANGKAAPAR